MTNTISYGTIKETLDEPTFKQWALKTGNKIHAKIDYNKVTNSYSFHLPTGIGYSKIKSFNECIEMYNDIFGTKMSGNRLIFHKQ